MENIPDDAFFDNNEPRLGEQTNDADVNVEISDDEKVKRNALARKRIDELMEQKKLKALLDDSDDW